MRLLEKILNEMYNVGGWVSPTGQYIETDLHINDILNHPSKFGLTAEYIKNIYAKHKESMMSAGRPTEGEARDELIELVTKAGWIRYRKYRNYWSINVYQLDSKTLDNIKFWIRAMIKSNIMHRNDLLKILDFKTDSLREVEADDILRNRTKLKESLLFNHKEVVSMSYKLAKKSTIIEQQDIELLLEVKLSRVHNHLQGPRPIAIITAFRGSYERTLQDNIRLNKELADTVRMQGFGFIWIDGAWVENKGEENEKHVSEVSLMIIGDENEKSAKKLFNLLVSSAKKYNQDGFIFKGLGEGSPVTLFDKNGNEVLTFNKVSMDKLADIYSRLRSGSHRGRTFIFEGERVDERPGFFSRLISLKSQ